MEGRDIVHIRQILYLFFYIWILINFIRQNYICGTLCFTIIVLKSCGTTLSLGRITVFR